MDWQWFVWRGLGSKWARKTMAGSITALVTWSLLWGPLVEWRQQQITQRMEQLVEAILDDQRLGDDERKRPVPMPVVVEENDLNAKPKSSGERGAP